MVHAVDGGATFALSHRLYRAVWNLVWFTLASWTPPPMHFWRRFLLRSFGAQLTGRPHIYGSSQIWLPKNLSMDNLSVLAPNVRCYNMAHVHIGAHAVVSQHAFLCCGYHDIDDPTFPLKTKAIVVGARAWVAAGAFIGPGVTLGEGAVVGAHSVLAGKDAAAWTVYAGNPAKKIRSRKPS